MAKIKGKTEKTTMRSLNLIVKIILMKLVLYDISIPLPMREFRDNIQPTVRSVRDTKSTSHAKNVQDSVHAEIPEMLEEVKLSISHRGKLDVGD